MNRLVDVLLGLQWGDEGKGKIVDALTPKYDIIARFNGGPNAGHTLEFNGIKHVLHIIPSGICHKDKQNIIGNGVVIEPVIFFQEIDSLTKIGFVPKDNLLISTKAHLILPTHRLLDAANEKHKGKSKIGSTLKGIGPCYTDKIARQGLRVGDIFDKDFIEKYSSIRDSHIKLIKDMGYSIDEFTIGDTSLKDYELLWLKAIEQLRSYKIIDTEYYLNEQLLLGKRVLAEGAQATMLDIDFGTYPFVTSSTTISAGVCTGLGISPLCINRIYGVMKAYCTRVGAGPFVTELFDKTGDLLCEIGHEYGATTGRRRRTGWLDCVAVKYACMLNGITDLVITKIDVMDDFDTINICEHYDLNGKTTDKIPSDLQSVKPIYTPYKGWKTNVSGIKSFDKLPSAMQSYVQSIEFLMGVRVSIISVSPDREDTIIRY